MMLEIENDTIHVWKEKVEGDWHIVGHQNLDVSYHPEWKANVNVLVGENRKGDTVIGYRLLVTSVSAPYKQEVYADAIMYSIADAFRRRLWDYPPSPSTSLGLGSYLMGCEND